MGIIKQLIGEAPAFVDWKQTMSRIPWDPPKPPARNTQKCGGAPNVARVLKKPAFLRLLSTVKPVKKMSELLTNLVIHCVFTLW